MRWRSILMVALALGVAAPAAVQAQNDTRPGVGIMPFENGGSFGQNSEDFEALTIGLQQLVMTELAINTNLRIVTRSQLDLLMSEQDLGASGRVDAATAARIGKLVGARYMVMGGFIDLYGNMTMTSQLVDTETGVIIKAEKVTDKTENIYPMVVQLADQITRGADLPALSSQVMNQRLEREIPQEAVRLYTRAMLYEQRGNTERAVELYTQVTREYPQYTEAQQALEQISGD
jgi:TolB-like protein